VKRPQAGPARELERPEVQGEPEAAEYGLEERDRREQRSAAAPPTTCSAARTANTYRPITAPCHTELDCSFVMTGRDLAAASTSPIDAIPMRSVQSMPPESSDAVAKRARETTTAGATCATTVRPAVNATAAANVAGLMVSRKPAVRRRCGLTRPTIETSDELARAAAAIHSRRCRSERPHHRSTAPWRSSQGSASPRYLPSGRS